MCKMCAVRGRVLLSDCGAPTGHSNFAAGLICLSLVEKSAAAGIIPSYKILANR